MIKSKVSSERSFRNAGTLPAKLALILALTALATAQTSIAEKGPSKMTAMTARGTFDVKIAPLETVHKDEPTLSRMSIDKQFHGDLEAISLGEMLAAGSGGPGSSGAYVAIEKVTGKLHGRAGTFMLHHVGIMERGAPSMSVNVVPDSGTGELDGIIGKLNIIIEGKKHSYEFVYSLPSASSNDK